MQSKTVIERFKAFNQLNCFQKAAKFYTAHNLKDHDVEKLREAFQTLDSNGDGELTLEEITSLSKSIDVDEQFLTAAFAKADTEGKGVLCYTDFLTTMIDEQQLAKREACFEAFRAFDTDRSGRLSVAELKAAVDSWGGRASNISLEEASEILIKVDVDGSGEIDFEEFMQMMSQIASEPLAAVKTNRSPIQSKN